MEDNSEKETQFSTDINDYETSEEVEKALSDPEIRDELIESIEMEIVDAAKSVKEYSPDVDDLANEIDNYFESDEFIEDLIENSPRDISFIPVEIIREITNPYVSISRHGNSLFSLENKKGDFRVFNTITFGDTNYVDPYTYTEIIELIPDKYINKFAKEFWRNVPNASVYGPYDFDARDIESEGVQAKIYFSLSKLNELAMDMTIQYFQKVSDDPDFVSNFMGVIEIDHPPRISNLLRDLLTKNNLTEEEQIDVIRLFVDQEDKIDIDGLIHRVSEFINTKNLEPEGILSIPKEVIKNWGINKGTLYENAPWTIYNLKATELFGEGVDMRLCLSDPEIGYYSQVINNEIEIWSIRSKSGKRRFTIEIDAKFRDAESPEEKGSLVYQVKGKANRLPGYKDAKSETIVFFDEVVFLMNLFFDLGIDVFSIEEMKKQALEIVKLNEDGLLSSKL